MSRGYSGRLTGSGFQNIDLPAPPGTSSNTNSPIPSPYTYSNSPQPESSNSTPDQSTPRLQILSKGVENAKKRLRAFSIQKKPPLTPSALPKITSGTGSTVLIGKLCSAKVSSKPPPEVEEQRKLLKPPKPGGNKVESYTEVKKKTVQEIEDMKRKMEMIELGIPLGLICPPERSETAMPTKAMPPIKSFLEPEKVDEIIREAKKARAEGKEFKFDYHKLLPGYDNPFQKKPKEPEGKTPAKKENKHFDRPRHLSKLDKLNIRDMARGKSRYNSRRSSEHRKSDRESKEDRDRDRHKGRDKDRSKERDKDRDKSKEISKEKDDKVDPHEEKLADKSDKDPKETPVDLKDFVVCDSWSLDNEDKTSSPQVEEKSQVDDKSQVDEKSQLAETIQKVENAKNKIENVFKDPMEQLRESLGKTKQKIEETEEKPVKIEKLQPVIDSFTYEIDPDDEEVLDIFDESIDIEKFAESEKSKRLKKVKDIDQDSLSQSSKDMSMDNMGEDFLESVIREIKQESMSDDDNMSISNDKGLVEYDLSPDKEKNEATRSFSNAEDSIASGTVTPEMKEDCSSQRSQYSDSGFRSTESFKSTESGYKSTESVYKSSESFKSTESDYKSTASSYKSTESSYKSTESAYKSTESAYKSTEGADEFRLDGEREVSESMTERMAKSTIDSLETWSFVLKICQPLLFRHDKNKCYKETSTSPKLWFAASPKRCGCVRDRAVVYQELDTCKMGLVDRVYGCDQIADYPETNKRGWYPIFAECLTETKPVQLSNEWDIESASKTEEKIASEEKSAAQDKASNREKSVNQEKSVSERVTQERGQKASHNTPKGKQKSSADQDELAAKHEDLTLDIEYQKFMNLVWPEVSDRKEEGTTPDRETQKETPDRREEKKKKRSERWSQETDEAEVEKKSSKKMKLMKADKEKSRKRKRSCSTISEASEGDADKKSKKKLSKKKLEKKNKAKEEKRRKLEKKYLKKLKEKQKKKAKKHKSEKIHVESDEEMIEEKPKKPSKKKQKKLKKKEQKKKKPDSSSSSTSSSSDSSSDSDTESEKESKKKKKKKAEEKSKKKKKDKKRKRKRSTSESSDQEFDENILNNIKTEKVEDEKAHKKLEEIQDFSPRRQLKIQPEIINMKELQNDFEISNMRIKLEKIEVPMPAAEACEEFVDTPIAEPPTREEKDELIQAAEQQAQIQSEPDKEPDTEQTIPLPEESSQASSQESTVSLGNKDENYEKDESHLRPSSQNSNYSFNDVISASQSGFYPKMDENEPNDYQNYEMYEQMAMEYQSGVASQPPSQPSLITSRIETVVSRARGEIKCDWRAGDSAPPPGRPSRWGLKPSDVNIVLTSPTESVYRIRSVLDPAPDDTAACYDEAYADMYGASDRLQYGDCFDRPAPAAVDTRSALDKRIDRALRDSVLGEVAKENDPSEQEKANRLQTTVPDAPRAGKRVSFADGYKPGQDSDTEEPPVKKRRRARRLGTAWPCPAEHPDHVPLWDALPPPPPPPGSPPPRRAPPLLLPSVRQEGGLGPPPHHFHGKFDPSSLPGLMPPEPPPLMRLPL